MTMTKNEALREAIRVINNVAPIISDEMFKSAVEETIVLIDKHRRFSLDHDEGDLIQVFETMMKHAKDKSHHECIALIEAARNRGLN